MSKGTILVIGSNGTELEAKGRRHDHDRPVPERNRRPANDTRRRRLRFRPRHPDRRKAAHGSRIPMR